MDVILKARCAWGMAFASGRFAGSRMATLQRHRCVRISIIEGAQIGTGAIGRYARLRPGTVLAEDVHVGNCGNQTATLGPGSKANHLSYLGDAVIGSKVNIGAGTITRIS